MRSLAILVRATCIAMVLSIVHPVARADNAHPDGVKATTIMRQSLDDLPGKEGEMALVEFPPGYADAPHRHAAHVFVYVLEGSVEMQVEGAKPVMLKRGDVFYEHPADVHAVGRNLSKTEPAKLLVFFLKDQNAPRVIPIQR